MKTSRLTWVVFAVSSLLSACDLGSVLPITGGDGGPGEEADAFIPQGRFHPADYAQAQVHGPAMKRNDLDCRTCHGPTLSGETNAAAGSCDPCHMPAQPKAWRTTCTFCHGGKDNNTGAPPRQLDGSTGGGGFPAHTAHVSTNMAASMDCVQCHTKAMDVLSTGHIFDSTKGVAEVDFGAGRSPQATFNKTTGCANTYCHGSGRADDGTVAQNAGAMTCASCHPSLASGGSKWGAMSGTHKIHLESANITCASCHLGVTSNNTSIVDAAKHVNGKRDIQFSEANVTRDAVAQTCTGSCHSHNHSGRPWDGGGNVHPAGFAAASVHGPEMSLQRQDCRGCHGATLQGSGAADSCDSCHQQGWRTKCTYCHGGKDNSTGAPGRDPGAPAGSASASFAAHTAHVTAGPMAVAYDCVQCHVKPTDVLSVNHAFDNSPEVGEVNMSAGISAAGTYAGNGSCANMWCHGNGRGNNGAYKDGDAKTSCGSCHPGMSSGSTAWSTMSGDHRMHLREGADCADCHYTVTTNSTSVSNKTLHINKKTEVSMKGGGTYTASTRKCSSNACHGSETW